MISESDSFQPSLDIPIVKEMRLQYRRKKMSKKMERNQECRNLSCKIIKANSVLVRRNFYFQKLINLPQNKLCKK